MANYGQADVAIKFSRSSATVASSATGMLPLQNYVLSMGALKHTGVVVKSDAFGDSWEETLFAGIHRREPLTLSGFYDDVAASGPHVLFGQTSDVGAERYCEFDVGASDVINGRVIIESYQTQPAKGTLTMYEVSLIPTGVWATAT